jgi:trypsin
MKRGKTTIFPAEPLNNFSISSQTGHLFNYIPVYLYKSISLTSSEPDLRSLAIVSGCGTLSSRGSLASQLQAVEVDIISRAACNSAYAAYGRITENMICAGVTGGGKDACSGDEGGPLVVGGQLIGIVSWGVGCAEAD